MDAISTGNLLNGEIAKWMNEKMRDYISSLFRPWRLVKAGDVSAVGAFKSSTIYGSEVIGWRKERTKYGEVFYLNFKRLCGYCSRHAIFMTWLRRNLSR